VCLCVCVSVISYHLVLSIVGHCRHASDNPGSHHFTSTSCKGRLVVGFRFISNQCADDHFNQFIGLNCITLFQLIQRKWYHHIKGKIFANLIEKVIRQLRIKCFNNYVELNLQHKLEVILFWYLDQIGYWTSNIGLLECT